MKLVQIEDYSTLVSKVTVDFKNIQIGFALLDWNETEETEPKEHKAIIGNRKPIGCGINLSKVTVTVTNIYISPTYPLKIMMH